MERLLAVWVEEIAAESPEGGTVRLNIALHEALTLLCPFTEIIRLGLFVLPVRGPSRFFGGEEAVLHAVLQCVFDVTSRRARVGIAEGLFCAELAAKAELVIAPGESEAFRRTQPLEVLGRKDLAATGHRLGIHSVGAFADIAPARIAERFNRHAFVLHRVARGELSEIPGQRDTSLTRRLTRLNDSGESVREQLGFFGQRGAGEIRAEEAAKRVRHRLGPESIQVANLAAGRTPQDRTAMVPWGSPAAIRDSGAPWPGQVGRPSPVTALRHPITVQLRDEFDQPIRVGERGLLSAAPAYVMFSPPQRRTITWHAGPWPLVERWWQQSRRRAQMQILLDGGEAMLLAYEDQAWWLTGIYD